MKFNFQKNEYDRVHFERDFSFKEFYEKVLPIYKNVEKKASPQFQQSQLKSQNQTINFKNIAFVESITLDYDDNFSNKMVQDLLERLRALGLAFIFFDTFSSKSDARRFRLMFEVGEKISPIEYKHMAKVISLSVVQLTIDEASYSPTQRYRLSNRGGLYHEGKPLNQFVVMDKMREKIKKELSKPKPQYTRKNIDIVRYILGKHDLKSEGNRNSALNKALFTAQKMGATSSEIEEIASHSTLPDSEKGYMIRRYTK